MRVVQILRKLVRGCRSVHKTRAQCVFEVVEALVHCKRLTIAALGRALRRNVAPKHCIKRVDRLIGNPRFRADLRHWYRAVARRLLTTVARPLVLLDWTEINRVVVLVASVPVRGRSIPIYSEAHPRSRFNNRHVNRAFLHALRGVLPRRCTPILVADAGFRGPFYECVDELHWGFIARVRGSKRRIHGVLLPTLLARATLKPTDLGRWQPKGSFERWRLVLSKRPARGRKAVRSRNDPAYRSRQTEPWLLATNEHQASARAIVDGYAQRMRIEEAFRDLKSIRFGFGLEHARTNRIDRIDAMVGIGALTTFVAVVAGLIAEDRNLARHHQANTAKRRVLSIVTLGCAVLEGGADFRFRIRQFIEPFRNQLREAFPQKPNRKYIDYDKYPF